MKKFARTKDIPIRVLNIIKRISAVFFLYFGANQVPAYIKIAEETAALIISTNRVFHQLSGSIYLDPIIPCKIRHKVFEKIRAIKAKGNTPIHFKIFFI